MQRILLLAGLLILGGCATTHDYRYVSVDGGYYTSEGYATSHSHSVAVYGGITGYTLGWYGYGPYGYGPGLNWSYPARWAYGSYWGAAPYYSGYWPYLTYHHVRRPRSIRHRGSLYRERVTQASHASRPMVHARPPALHRHAPVRATPRMIQRMPVNDRPATAPRPIMPRGAPRMAPLAPSTRAAPARATRQPYSGTRSTTTSPRTRSTPRPRAAPAPSPVHRSSSSTRSTPRGIPSRRHGR